MNWKETGKTLIKSRSALKDALFWVTVSSVRSSYSHPDLLLTQHPEVKFVHPVSPGGSVKFVASGVNFSIFTNFLCFFLLKLLKLGEIGGVKFLTWKSGGVKFWTNFMSVHAFTKITVFKSCHKLVKIQLQNLANFQRQNHTLGSHHSSLQSVSEWASLVTSV